jgi:beta-glucosidase
MHRRSFLAASAGSAALIALPAASTHSDWTVVEFPRDFLWGVSTSAFQIEGGLKADGRGPSIWDQVAADDSGLIAEPAVDHYRHWRRDITLLKQLGVNAYRFSVAWPRVLPEGDGPINDLGLDFYDRLIDGLLEARITPVLCLYHWDLPKALQSKGGWCNRDMVGSFTRYARIVAGRLGDRVQHWIAINEAYSVAYGGYGIGFWPPFVADERTYFAVAHHLNLAQGATFKELASPGRRFGTAMMLNPVRCASPAAEDVRAARFHEAMSTKLFLDPLINGRYPELVETRLAPFIRENDMAVIRHPVDFLGINYYEPEYRRSLPGAPFGTEGIVPIGVPLTDSGAVIDPDGLYQQLIELRDHYGNPKIYITENGAAFDDRPDSISRIDDLRRIAFLRDHLVAAHRALSQGVNLAGYFVWSLIDNFEWRSGFKVRYGLVYLDPCSGRRARKSSFDWYGKIARGFPVHQMAGGRN